MLLQLIRFEVLFHLRQNTTRVALLALFLLGLGMARGSFGNADVLQDSPVVLALFVGLLSLGSYIVVSLLAGGAILRDREHHMEEIVHATGLGHASYLTSRFLGLVIATTLCFTAGVVGLYLGRFLPGVDANRFASLSPLPYLAVWAHIGLPNLLLGNAVIFAAGALTRSALATYVSGIALYAFYWTLSILGNSPLMAQSKPLAGGDATLGALFEPTGMVAVFEQTRFWSTLEKNSRGLPLEGLLLHNRLLWLGTALIIFALTYHFFSFRAAAKAPRPTLTPPSVLPAAQEAPRPDYRPLQPQPAGALAWQATWSHTRLAVASLLRGLPFVGLMVLWLPFVWISLTDSLRRGDLEVPLRAVTELLLPAMIEPLNLLGTLVVAYFAAELAWRERGARMDGLVDATACPPAALQLGRLLALATVIGILVLTAIALGVAVQLSAGESPELALYASLFVRCGVPLLAIGALALALQALAPEKYSGLAATFLVVVLATGQLVPRSVLVDNPVWRLGAMPEYLGSAMAGGFHDAALPWWAVLAMGWSSVLVVASLGLLRRGRRREALPRWAWAVAAAGGAIALGAGFTIAGLSAATGTSLDPDERLDWRAAYERSYAGSPPTAVEVADVMLETELHPAARRLDLETTITLENRGAEPVDQLRLFLDPRLRQHQLTVSGATLTVADEVLATADFAFTKPMAPGDSAQLQFSATLDTSAFARPDPEAYVLPKASYIELHKLLPSLTFRDDWTIDSPGERRQRGLATRVPEPDPTPQPDHANWVPWRLRVTTVAGQTVVAPGRLERTRHAGDRMTFDYRSNGPWPLEIAVASAVYEVHEARSSSGVWVTAYLHSDHNEVATSLLAGATATLDYAGTHFGPYPEDNLRIAEIPAFSDRFGATALPGAVFAVENRVFLADTKSDPTIQPAFRTIAHEVGHQWWGHQLEPALVAGHPMLTEALAVATELLVVEQELGPTASRAYLERVADLYFEMRHWGDEPERPLVTTVGQPAVHYFKAALVANALRHLLGEEVLTGVLRDFLAERAYPHKPIALELVARLEAAAPPEHRSAVHELLAEVVTYQLELHGVTAKTSPDGEHILTLDLTVRRTSSDTLGTAQSWLEVGVGADPTTAELHRLWIDRERSQVELVTRAADPTVWLDPRGLLLVEPGSTRSGAAYTPP